MYSINGIDLTGSQYRELTRLVSLEDDDARRALAESELIESRDPVPTFCEDAVARFRALDGLGLVSGSAVMGGYLFDRVTEAGLDFVNDYEEELLSRRERLWSDRRFQIFLSILTFVLSTFAGWLAGHSS